MENDALIDTLKGHPSAKEIERILKQFDAEDKFSTEYFKLVLVLANHTLFEVFDVTPQATQRSIISLLKNVVGIAALLRLLEAAAVEVNFESKGKVDMLLRILSQIFDTSLVGEVIKDTLEAQMREIDRLIFKGKVLGVVNEVKVKYDLDVQNRSFQNSLSYAIFCAAGLASVDTDLKMKKIYLSSIKALNSTGFFHFVELHFNTGHWEILKSMYSSMRKFEKIELSKDLLKFASNYLKDNESEEKLAAFASLLEFISPSIDFGILKTINSWCNLNLNVLVALILLQSSEFRPQCQNLLEDWSDESMIKLELLTHQEFKTHLLISCLLRLDEHYVNEIMASPSFINGISNHLSSHSESVKFLAISLANSLSAYTGSKLIFDMEIPDNFQYLSKMESYYLSHKSIANVWDVVNIPTVEEVDEPLAIVKVGPNQITGDDDDSDDETLYNRAKLHLPIYIKELLEYLSVDEEDQRAYDMCLLALEAGPNLLRQKKGFGTEVMQYADDLMRILIGKLNRFAIEEFETMKLNNMIAVLSSNPKSALFTCQLLLTGDYSLQQRMMILTAFSLAVRELRGFHDAEVTKSYKLESFPTKMLPTGVHEAFASLDLGPVSQIERGIQNNLMEEAADEARDQIQGGRVLRLSSKLKRGSKATTETLKATKDFGKIVASNFYLPLVRFWYEAQGMEMGHYTSLLVSHYLKTLTLILHAAYPLASNIYDMTNELLAIIVPIITEASIEEIQLIESAVTSFMLILDIADEGQLVSDHSVQLASVKTSLEGKWELIIDPRVKSLCANLILRLSAISKKLERLIMDQMNSIY